MQQFPNYWTNSYQQYQQPMQQMQPTINPYMQQFQQMNQTNQQFLQSSVAGRFVDDFSAITANDVPMDGSGAIFVKKDGSEIQVRNWTANGTIASKTYKPIINNEPKEMNKENNSNAPAASEELVAMFKEQFEKINKRFDENLLGLMFTILL